MLVPCSILLPSILSLAFAQAPTQPPATNPEAPVHPPEIHLPWGGIDFVQYYVCGRLALEHKNPYDLEAAGRLQREYGNAGEILPTYGPPTTLLPFIPLSRLDFPTATNLNLAFNVLLLLLCSLAWSRMLFPHQPGLMPLLAMAVPIWVPSLSLLALGQNTVWVLAGVTGWVWALERQRPILGGVLLALVIMKPHLGLPILLFALVYMFRNRLGCAAIAVLTTLFAWDLAAELAAPGITAHYLNELAHLPPPTVYFATTLSGWGRARFGPWFGAVGWVLYLFGLAAALHGGWSHKPANGLVPKTLGIVLLSPCITPHAYSYDFVLLLPGFFLALGACLIQRRWASCAILAGWLFLDFWLMQDVLVALDRTHSWWIPWAGLFLAALSFKLHPRLILPISCPTPPCQPR